MHGVGHGAPVKALPEMRCADPRSAQIGGPNGISQTFQVKAYSGEPVKPGAARNLLSKDDCRAALRDEAAHFGPEMSLVVSPAALSGNAERLAGAGTGPDGRIVGDAGKSKGEGPAPNTREEVSLAVSHKVIWTDIDDAPFVHVAGREMAGGDEGAQPSGGEGVNLVVVGGG